MFDVDGVVTLLDILLFWLSENIRTYILVYICWLNVAMYEHLLQRRIEEKNYLMFENHDNQLGCRYRR